MKICNFPACFPDWIVLQVPGECLLVLWGWKEEVKRGRPVRSGRDELGEGATDALLQSWG